MPSSNSVASTSRISTNCSANREAYAPPGQGVRDIFSEPIHNRDKKSLSHFTYLLWTQPAESVSFPPSSRLERAMHLSQERSVLVDLDNIRRFFRFF
mmetsp:Transcript_6674/g.15238  ORF Transcript_6674/g.15238 Transcript_6674/m.15238 type:complete len:97 (+) Transcript_6674:1462-1752(+)